MYGMRWPGMKFTIRIGGPAGPSWGGGRGCSWSQGGFWVEGGDCAGLGGDLIGPGLRAEQEEHIEMVLQKIELKLE